MRARLPRFAFAVLLAPLAVALAACVGGAPGGDDDDDDDVASVDAGPNDPDAGDVTARCEVPTPAGDGARPVALLPAARLADVAAAMPCIADPALVAVLESPDTIFYDEQSIVPGYQDSFGDNVIAPIGMRPNTIDSSLIDTAVPGGHAQIFVERGVFHFPFGRPIGSPDQAAFVIDFWHVPREGGALLPVVWWMREPNDLTHRIEWIFPAGTIFGELMFTVAGDGSALVFEVRTRTREIDGWRVDAHRPFPTAEALAAALEELRAKGAEGADDASVDALLAHLRDDSTLEVAELGATHFASAFPTVQGARDVLPPVDEDVARALLADTPFVSARGMVWKQDGGLRAYAPTTETASLHVVPQDYNAGLIAVDDEACGRCHRDAGRPFRDWYDNILAYGELWGGDEIFTWHPFATERFVDDDGDVVEFNYDNREMRGDFVAAGLLAPYDAGAHTGDTYRVIEREWTGFAY